MWRKEDQTPLLDRIAGSTGERKLPALAVERVLCAFDPYLLYERFVDIIWHPFRFVFWGRYDFFPRFIYVVFITWGRGVENTTGLVWWMNRTPLHSDILSPTPSDSEYTS